MVVEVADADWVDDADAEDDADALADDVAVAAANVCVDDLELVGERVRVEDLEGVAVWVCDGDAGARVGDALAGDDMDVEGVGDGNSAASVSGA